MKGESQIEGGNDSHILFFKAFQAELKVNAHHAKWEGARGVQNISTQGGWIRVHKVIRAERKRRLNQGRPYRPSKGYGLPFCRKHWMVLVGKVEDSTWIGWAVTSTSRIYFLFTFHIHGYRSAMTFLCVLPFRVPCWTTMPQGRQEEQERWIYFCGELAQITALTSNYSPSHYDITMCTLSPKNPNVTGVENTYPRKRKNQVIVKSNIF